MDPFQGLASFILGKLKDSTVALWWRFLFEIAFTAVASFLIACGVSTRISHSLTLGAADGMIAAAVCMAYLFRKESNRLTKGMIVVLPQLEAAEELKANLQVIEKSK